MISIFTATFKDFLIIFFLLFIHEIGHYTIARLYKLPVQEIKFYPIGGILKLSIPLNYSQLKELIILLAGPIFQFIAYFLLLKIESNTILVKNYHYGILLFNLLPIYPLDGGRILNTITSYYFPYKLNFKLTFFLSMVFLILFFIFTYQELKINVIIISIYLIIQIIRSYKKIETYYNKFLLERYLNNYHFTKSKLINSKNNFYRNNRHLLNINGKYYLEKDYLARIYQKKWKRCWHWKNCYAIILLLTVISSWGISSAGRAPRLHRGGQRFDPAMLHHIEISVEKSTFFCRQNYHIFYRISSNM